MKELNNKAKRDNQWMNVLKVTEMAHILSHTSKGQLTISLTKGGTGADYKFILDAVPFDDKTNKELLDIYSKELQ